MGRPKRLAPWMADALDLGIPPERVLSKMRNLRNSKAGKFGVTVAYMEAVYGWDLDEMAGSLIYAIENERCRGPRCGRVRFRVLLQTPAHLSLITCDILDLEVEPLWCMNVRWCCESDNKGDRDTSMRERIGKLIEARERLVSTNPVDTRVVDARPAWTQEELPW